jgi:glycerol-3-phosphate dehydrogenase
VIDNLQSAVRAGAAVMNYTRFNNARRSGKEWVCALTRVHEGDSLEVQARTIVNAAGPWADHLQGSGVRLRLTKGIHLVLDRRHLPVPDAVVITEGKRILFVIPWGERLIVGTTDTDYEGAIEEVRTQPEDVDYIFAAMRKFFPDVAISESDVISSWAGLRPLIADSRGRPSDLSRSHQILHPQPGWWDVAGGKLTTYRLMAEQAVDKVVAELNMQARSCQTAQEPLTSGNDSSAGSAVVPPPFCRERIEHCCLHEWAMHLDDVMMRRTSWHYYHKNASELARQALDWMSIIQNWNETQREAEWRRYQQISDWPPRELATLPDMPHAAAL